MNIKVVYPLWYFKLKSRNESIKRQCILLMSQSPIFSGIVNKLEWIPSSKGNHIYNFAINNG